MAVSYKVNSLIWEMIASVPNIVAWLIHLLDHFFCEILTYNGFFSLILINFWFIKRESN